MVRADHAGAHKVGLDGVEEILRVGRHVRTPLTDVVHRHLEQRIRQLSPGDTVLAVSAISVQSHLVNFLRCCSFEK